MKVQLNNKEMELPHSFTIAQLATQLELSAQGIAIAVNNQLVPRTHWHSFSLQQNDHLVIIKAACGG